MRKKMLFLVNPNAGQSEIRSHLMEVVDIFSRGGYDVTVRPTTRPHEIPEIIVTEGAEYDMVVAAGGDGTLNETACGLMQLEHPPVLGYIPSGTVNDVASTLHLPKNAVKAARTIVEGRALALDIGTFNAQPFVYVAAFGAFTDVAYRTAQSDKRLLGRMAYLLEGAKALTDIHPVHIRVQAEGYDIEDDVIFGIVANTTSVGGFKVKSALEVSLNDGLSEVILVKDIKNVLDLNAVATKLVKQDFDNAHFYSFHTDKVKFSFDVPVPWTLDGEFGGAIRQAEVENHRCALRIMVPNDLSDLPTKSNPPIPVLPEG